MQILKIIFIYLLFLPNIVFASGTVVGNGGDPILHFLEASRFALVETLKDIHNDSLQGQSFCSEENALTTSQQQFCRDYIFEIIDQMIALNTQPKIVPFVLREEPLYVTGPDGKPMPVAARTELGESGPIEFNLDSIKLMAPKLMLHLVSHEFQHKSLYRGANLTDNDPIGPFQYGRLLIDSVASAIVKVALKNGRIGNDFILRDSFDCQIKSGASQFGLRTSTQRWFFDSSLTNYRFSLSQQPNDPLIYVTETVNSKIVYQLEVSDKNNCTDMINTSLRKSRITLWRVFDNPNTPAVLLTEENIAGLNPLCENTPTTFIAQYESFRFECTYYGTEAH